MRHNFAANNLTQHLFYLTGHARLLADHFISLKTARETADYDPNQTMNPGDANYWIAHARAALNALQAMRATDRRTFSNITLTGRP